MEQVLSICNEDPELNNLLKDHPILIKALESIPNLQAEHIFSILTAVENEVRTIQTYLLTSDLQSGQNERKSLIDPSMEVEELKIMLVKEQEYNKSLNKVTEKQQIIKISESFNELSKTLQERSVSNTSKLMNFVLLERENKDLKDQVFTLTEKLEELSIQIQDKSLDSPGLMGKRKEVTEVQKSGALALKSLLKRFMEKQVDSVFSMIKFWIYKKSKIQEELESKVIPIQLQQNFSHRAESLNEIRACNKKYFSQLVNLISSVNDQKPLEIELSNCDLSLEWLELLFHSLENNSSVTELNLGSNSLSDDCGRTITEWLKIDSYLKCLILRNNDFNDLMTFNIIEAICSQNQIVMLDISENVVSVESIIYLIQNSSTISDLVIENCGLSGEDIRKILSIAKNSTLSGLFVSYNPITKQSIKAILEGFQMTGLKNIGLSGLPIEDADVKDICTLINKKPYLEILHLAHVDISEQAMSRVLDCLCKHDDLKEIDLTGTSLHIPHVCVVIETCAFLKTIVLREISVSPRDYSYLAETIKKSPQLEVCLLDN
jgi:hypothetical protein